MNGKDAYRVRGGGSRPSRRDSRGFTLAELLIVVAIIAILIAIAIPVFTKQLEKSRDSTTAANLRSAYAEATTAYVDNAASGRVTSITPSGGEILVTVSGVNIKSSDETIGDLKDNLPFGFASDEASVLANKGVQPVTFHFPAGGEGDVTVSGAGGGTPVDPAAYQVTPTSSNPVRPSGRRDSFVLTDLFEVGANVSYSDVTIVSFEYNPSGSWLPLTAGILPDGTIYNGSTDGAAGIGPSSIRMTISYPDENGNSATATYNGSVFPSFMLCGTNELP